MTRQRYDEHSTEFGLWIRRWGLDSRCEGLDVQNLDYILFDYLHGRLMLLEEKRHGARPTVNQKDTHGVVDQLLRLGVATGVPVQTMRGLRTVRYEGLHVVRFEATTPDDSKWIELDGRAVSASTFVHFIGFGRTGAAWQSRERTG